MPNQHKDFSVTFLDVTPEEARRLASILSIYLQNLPGVQFALPSPPLLEVFNPKLQLEVADVNSKLDVAKMIVEFINGNPNVRIEIEISGTGQFFTLSGASLKQDSHQALHKFLSSRAATRKEMSVPSEIPFARWGEPRNHQGEPRHHQRRHRDQEENDCLSSNMQSRKSFTQLIGKLTIKRQFRVNMGRNVVWKGLCH